MVVKEIDAHNFMCPVTSRPEVQGCIGKRCMAWKESLFQAERPVVRAINRTSIFEDLTSKPEVGEWVFVPYDAEYDIGAHWVEAVDSVSEGYCGMVNDG